MKEYFYRDYKLGTAVIRETDFTVFIRSSGGWVNTSNGKRQQNVYGHEVNITSIASTIIGPKIL